MTLWQRYLRPTSIQEAVEALDQAHPHGRPIAGGTDLLIDLQQGRDTPPHTMVDISGISALAQVEQHDGYIFIGAGVTHRRIVHDPMLKDHASALVKACGLIGGPQVRNVATLGGNVAHALPAGDGTIALLALGAEAELTDREGRRWLPMGSLFSGPGQTTFDRSRQLLTRLRFRQRGPNEGSAFDRVMRPQGIAIAILNLSVWLQLNDRGQVAAARFALGPSGPTPRLSSAAEQAVLGQSRSDQVLKQIRQGLLADARLRTSRHRATQSYREHLVGVLVERAVPEAWEQAEAAAAAPGSIPPPQERQEPHVHG